MKKINELTDAILRDEYRAEFERLYGSDDGDEYNRQKSRYMDALSEFKSLFDVEMAMVFSAPGRSEICGNHTDHQSGMALAASVSCDMIAIVSERDDNVVSIISDGFGECVLSTEDLQAHNEECGTTKALVRGILSGFKMNNYEIGGFNAYVTSDVLSGSGLSSSAAFEILMGTVISELYNKSVIPPETLAKIGQFSENRYFGKPCGLLDQLACAVGGLIFIDFKDTDIISKFCDFSDLGYSLCITATGGSHDNLTDEYAAIPSEMKAVAAFFNKSVQSSSINSTATIEINEPVPDFKLPLTDVKILTGLCSFDESATVNISTDGSVFEGSSFKFKTESFQITSSSMDAVASRMFDFDGAVASLGHLTQINDLAYGLDSSTGNVRFNYEDGFVSFEIVSKRDNSKVIINGVKSEAVQHLEGDVEITISSGAGGNIVLAIVISVVGCIVIKYLMKMEINLAFLVDFGKYMNIN